MACDGLNDVFTVVEHELELEAADRKAGVTGAGHELLGLVEAIPIRRVAGPQTIDQGLTTDVQLSVTAECEDRVALELRKHERWRDALDDAVEEAREQWVCLRDERAARHVRSVRLADRPEESRVAGDVRQDERAALGPRTIVCGHRVIPRHDDRLYRSVTWAMRPQASAASPRAPRASP